MNSHCEMFHRSAIIYCRRVYPYGRKRDTAGDPFIYSSDCFPLFKTNGFIRVDKNTFEIRYYNLTAIVVAKINVPLHYVQ